MKPILFEWGPVLIPAWHAFYVLGALAAYFLLKALARRFEPEIPQVHLSRMFVAAYLGGYFGARLLSIFIDEPNVTGFGGTLVALFRLGPMTFYGGAIGSFLCALAYALAVRIPFAKLLDLGLPAGLLALAIGRIGCFLNGDDFGKPVPLEDGGAPWWSVTFPNLQDGIARYPVQLISTFCVGLLVFGLWLGFPRIRNRFGAGAVGLFAILAYAVYRFLIEFWRGDPRGEIAGLSTSQFISLVAIAICAVYALLSRRTR